MEIGYEVELPGGRDALPAARARIGARPGGGAGGMLFGGPEAGLRTAPPAAGAEPA